jgi:predicted nucleotidyltransferase
MASAARPRRSRPKQKIGELLDQRRRFADKRLRDLSRLIRPADTDRRGCVYVTGSFARGEASQHSDLDLFILSGEGSTELNNLDAICLKADLIHASEELRLPKFSGDGEFLQVHRLSDIVRSLGEPHDDSSNAFTARLLLLLESRPLIGNALYANAIDDVVAKYWRDYADHADAFMPAFLANDILRLWRTFCVNYEARTRTEPDEKKAKRKLKNYKLKHSRLLTCYSALAYLLVTHSKHGTVTPDAVRRMIAKSPTDRIRSRKIASVAATEANRVIELYEQFLDTTDATEADLVARFLDRSSASKLMEHAGKFGGAMFELLRTLGADSRFYRLLVV